MNIQEAQKIVARLWANHSCELAFDGKDIDCLDLMDLMDALDVAPVVNRTNVLKEKQSDEKL